ncbi:unnamed protein product [Rangifer tarandus platyrhynchus]|uniref:Uncharacterized protein n=1 Tax=Rangifer tarandus platyrhynchus TaxID=3082113 RepID=A0AC59ZHI9_RANTA
MDCSLPGSSVHGILTLGGRPTCQCSLVDSNTPGSHETLPNSCVPLPCPSCFHLSGTTQLQIPAAMRVLQAVGRRGLGVAPPSVGSLSLVLIKLFHPPSLV